MPDEWQGYQAFTVKYHRQGRTNQWKARTTEAQDGEAFKTEGVKSSSIGGWVGQREEDLNHASIFVSVKLDPGLFDMSPEREEALIAMSAKAREIADQEFLRNHPDAEIVHVDED